MLSSVGGLIGAMLAQGRFKAEDVHLAAREDIYSRFLIIPKKTGSPFNIACGSIDGFSGFIDRRFRIHDFELGRRNAQRFFEKHFAVEYKKELKKEYTLFESWLDDEEMVKKYSFDDGGKTYIPLIPLMGKATSSIPRPSFEDLTVDDIEKKFRAPVRARVKALMKNINREYTSGMLNFGLKLLIGLKSKKFGDKALEAMVKMLKEDGLVK
jgi:hypothetical protein